MLDETLEDKSDAATDKLAVYYTCVGLGFTGWHTGQPEVLRRKMLEISARVRTLFETNPQSYICPDAYSHLNTSDLIQPPAASLGGIAIALVGLAAVLLVTYVFLYRDRSDELKAKLNQINQQGNTAMVNDAAGAAQTADAAAGDQK
jgi:type VI protein secretion system component VasF